MEVTEYNPYEMSCNANIVKNIEISQQADTSMIRFCISILEDFIYIYCF